MQKWEYLEVVVSMGRDVYVISSESKEPREVKLERDNDLLQLFNELGMEGWEMVSMTIAVEAAKAFYHFKRRIE